MNRQQWRALAAVLGLIFVGMLFGGVVTLLRSDSGASDRAESSRDRDERRESEERSDRDDRAGRDERRDREDREEPVEEEEREARDDRRRPRDERAESPARSAEFETGVGYEYDARDRFCQIERLHTDLVQDLAQTVAVSRREQRAELSPSVEERLGRDLLRKLTTDDDSELSGTILREDPRAAYLSALLARIVGYDRPRGQFPYEVSLLDSQMENAFALPGGQIVVTTAFLGGDLIENEAQLVGVLAHEVAHIHHRHTTAVWEILAERGESIDVDDLPLASVLRFLSTPLSSEQEDEADAYGLVLLEALGYSPYQFERMWFQQAQREGDTGNAEPDPGARTQEETLRRELGNLIQTHASARERSCRARSQIDAMQLSAAEPYYVGRSNLNSRQPWTGRGG